MDGIDTNKCDAPTSVGNGHSHNSNGHGHGHGVELDGCCSCCCVKFPALVVKRAYLLAGLTMGLCLILAIVDSTELTVDTAPPKGRPAYAVRGEIRTKRIDSWIDARDEAAAASENAVQTTCSVKSPNSFLPLIYQGDKDQVVTEANIRFIHDLEQRVRSDPRTINHCWRCPLDETKWDVVGCHESNATNPVCRPPKSVINFFYPSTVSGAVATKLGTTTVYDGRGATMADFATTLAFLATDAMLNQSNPNGASFFFGKTFTPSNPITDVLRSQFEQGLPLVGYPLDYIDTLDQDIENDDWTIAMIEDYVQPAAKSSPVSIIYSGGNYVANWIIQSELARDSLLIMASFFFVWLYLSFHTGSFFVGSFGMLHIAISFPVAHFIQFFILDIKYFDILSIFLLFVIMGIGADDVFVFFDSWEQARAELGNSDATLRMQYAFQRAAKAMLVTSSTTAGAFLATATSPQMPTIQFGVFAFLMVVVNYALVITWFPALLTIWENFFRHRSGICCCMCDGCSRCLQRLGLTCCEQAEFKRSTASAQSPKAMSSDLELTSRADKESPESPQDAEKSEKSSHDLESPKGVDSPKSSELDVIHLNGIEVISLETRNPLSKFLFRRFTPLISNKFACYAILTIALGYTCMNIWMTTQLEGASETPKFMPDDHVLTRYQVCSEKCFPQSSADDLVEANYVYGINADAIDWQGRSIFEFGSKACDGGPCGKVVYDDTFDLTPTANQLALINVCDTAPAEISCVVGSAAKTCYMKDFRDWRVANGQSFPVPTQAELYASTIQFLNISTWRNKYVLSKTVYMLPSGQLRYVGLEFQINFQRRVFYTGSQVDPCYNQWNDFASRQNAAAPAGVNKAFPTTNPIDGLFINGKMSDTFTQAAVTGVIVALAIALFVLLVSTQNFIVAAFSWLWIISVVLAVFGIMYMNNWDIGVIEAISAAMVVGFSVDYTVHFANHYVESSYDLRGQRVAVTILEMGVSVLSGAITTFGASSFLLAANLLFFNRFGIFMVCTVVFSIIVAFFPFLATLQLVGPEGKTGNFVALFEQLRAKVSPSKD